MHILQSRRDFLASASLAAAAGPEHAMAAANCFVELGANTVVVNSMAALQTAVNAAPPGRQILIAPGTYTGGTFTFNRDGTQANPIVIRPQGAIGSVTINNASWTLADTSSWLVFEKLHFTNGRITLAGDHNRISRCRFRDIQRTAILVGDNTGRGARDCRIDHCDFADFTNPTTIHNCINLRGGEFADGNNARILIDFCYFHDLNAASGPNGREPIGTYASVTTIALPRGETVIVDHCLFQNIRLTGEDECITVKQGGWIIRFCTFNNLGLEPVFRSTQDSELRSCWFEAMPRPRIYGRDNLIIGNRFIGNVDIFISCGNATTEQVIAGTAPIDSYARCANNRVIGNRMGSGHIVVGTIAGTTVPDESALNNVLEANTRDSGAPAHTLTGTINGFSPGQVNTTVRATTTAAFTPAVKLTATGVGLNAADPLCQ
jgi:poly(beta-D-mannuronate) lyase